MQLKSLFVDSPFKRYKTYLKLKSSFQSCCHVADKMSNCIKSKMLAKYHINYHPLGWSRLLIHCSLCVPFNLLHNPKTNVFQPFPQADFFLAPVKLFLILVGCLVGWLVGWLVVFLGAGKKAGLYHFIHSIVIFILNNNALQTLVQLLMAILRKEGVRMILCKTCVGIIDNYSLYGWCTKSSN